MAGKEAMFLHLCAGTTALAVTTAVGASAWRQLCLSRAQIKNPKEEPNLEAEEMCETLLGAETKFWDGDFPPISTITWFDGDHQAAAEYLKKRVLQIVAANPWLGGRVKRRDGKLVVTFRKAEPLTFQHVAPEDSVLDRSSHAACAQKSMLPYLVKNTTSSPVFRVTLMPCTKKPMERFAMVVSMSHVVADGHTFYTIHNMLSPSKPICALAARRSEAACDRMLEVLAAPKLRLGFILLWAAGNVWKAFSSLVLSTRRESRHGLVNNAFIAQQKKAAKTDSRVAFVSTNDVLTSLFFGAVRCDVGMMAVNFRGRVPGIRNSDAGNYQRGIYFLPRDWESPSLIRQSLSTLRRAATGNEPEPSVLSVLKGTGALITNWATFAEDNELPNCSEDVHTPLFDVLDMPPNVTACIVYRARSGQLGLMLSGKPEKVALTRGGAFADLFIEERSSQLRRRSGPFA